MTCKISDKATSSLIAPGPGHIAPTTQGLDGKFKDEKLIQLDSDGIKILQLEKLKLIYN